MGSVSIYNSRINIGISIGGVYLVHFLPTFRIVVGSIALFAKSGPWIFWISEMSRSRCMLTPQVPVRRPLSKAAAEIWVQSLGRSLRSADLRRLETVKSFVGNCNLSYGSAPCVLVKKILAVILEPMVLRCSLRPFDMRDSLFCPDNKLSSGCKITTKRVYQSVLQIWSELGRCKAKPLGVTMMLKCTSNAFARKACKHQDFL